MGVSGVALWGASGHARVLRDALAGLGLHVTALFDRAPVPPPWPGAEVMTGREGLARWRAAWVGPLPAFLVAVGGARGADRLEIAGWLTERGLGAMTLVHRAATVEPSATLEPGAQILAGAVVGAGATVGRHAIVNTRAAIDHDSRLGAGSHLAPGVVVCGETVIGSATFIGAGAVIGPKLTIGDGATVGAGAVVLRDVPPGARVWGAPARPR
jgi:sugar O-acyltransferase (sialic acid O-acetyltransferase NeuD family)